MHQSYQRKYTAFSFLHMYSYYLSLLSSSSLLSAPYRKNSVNKTAWSQYSHYERWKGRNMLYHGVLDRRPWLYPLAKANVFACWALQKQSGMLGRKRQRPGYIQSAHPWRYGLSRSCSWWPDSRPRSAGPLATTIQALPHAAALSVTSRFCHWLPKLIKTLEVAPLCEFISSR